MALSLGNYEQRTKEAIAYFWGSRNAALQAQIEKGKQDAGTRGAVTAGKNLDGFLPLIVALLKENGLEEALVEQKKSVRTLPGFFRPTKNWDYVISYRGILVAVLEMKSQVGSFGNNFNNRTEESLGNATDFWRAFREGAFGSSSRPFLGYLMVVEDCPGSTTKCRLEKSVFPAFKEFTDTSYMQRYQLLCQKLVSENLYTAAALLATPTGSTDGSYKELCAETGMKRLVSLMAGAIAAAAAETKDTRSDSGGLS